MRGDGYRGSGQMQPGRVEVGGRGGTSVRLECSPADVTGEGQVEVPLGCALLSIFWP